MASILAQVFVCILLLDLPFNSGADTRRPENTMRRERASEERNHQSPWVKFLNKITKPFRAVDSALHLIRGSNNDGRKMPDVITAVMSSTERPVTEVSMMPLIMFPGDNDTAVSKISSTTSATVGEPPDMNQWNLRSLTKGPCGTGGGNLTDEESLVSPGQYPWMALLQYSANDSNEHFFCGGSLINDRYVLTAATCLDIPGYKLVSVRLGEYNLDYFGSDCTDFNDGFDDVVAIEACEGFPPVDHSVSSVQAHPKYNPDTGANDIGLIRLKKKVKYTSLISPICLPLGDVNIKWDGEKVASDLILAGWGSKSVVPNQAVVTRADPADCEDALGATVRHGQMCAGGPFCHGETGDALITLSEPIGPGNSEETVERFVQLAVLSSKLEDCDTYPPSIYIGVQKYLPWILAKIKP